MGKGLFIIHRINMRVRRAFVAGYYKLIYGRRFSYGSILAGVHIGDNCLIFKDIPANSLVRHKEDLIIDEKRGGNDAA